jgi:hypothetical protein
MVAMGSRRAGVTRRLVQAGDQWERLQGINEMREGGGSLIPEWSTDSNAARSNLVFISTEIRE